MKKLPEGHLDRYDWSRATRGRLAKRILAEGTNLRALDEELAAAFPDSASVNAALHAVLALRTAMVAPTKRRARRTAA